MAYGIDKSRLNEGAWKT